MAKAPGATRPAGSRGALFALCVCLAALVWIVFGQTLGHDFVNFDDNKYVYENAQVSSGLSFHGVAWAFTRPHNNLWHPLTTLSNMLDCQIFGLKPGGAHFTNVFFHTLAVLWLFLLLEQLTGALWRSAFVAAIFAIHPLRVESVAWIAERKDVLSGVFFMMTLFAYARYARRRTLGRYVIMSILFACGLMSKAMLVTLPFVLLLLDYWPLKRIDDLRDLQRRVFEKLPLLVLSAAAGVVTILVQQPTISSLQGLPMSWRIGNAFVAVVTYIRQMFWPAKLAVFYPHPYHQLPAWLIALSIVLVAGISIIAIIVRRKHPYVPVGWFWYLGMLAPVLGIVQVGLQGHADRFTYLPSIGIMVLVTWTLADLSWRWLNREVILGIAAALLIAAFAWRASIQTSYWHDSLSLWTHTLAVTSNNATAHLCLASALFERGRAEEAISHSQAAAKIDIAYAGAYGEVPVILTDEQTRAAIAYWLERLKDHPHDVEAHDSLGVILFQSGNVREAISQWQISLEISPNDGNAENNLAWVLATYPDEAIRRGDKAVELAEKAARLPGGENPIVLRTLAAAYAEDGQFAKAIETGERSRELANTWRNPSLVKALEMDIALYRRNTPLRNSVRENSPP